MSVLPGESSGKPPLQILHVVVAGEIGGAERLIADLVRVHAGNADTEHGPVRHAVALFTPSDALRTFFARELDPIAVPVFDRGAVRENPAAYVWRSFGPLDLAWLAKTIRHVEANVVHLHTFASHVLGVRAARAVGVPTVRTEHHVMHYHDPSTSTFTRWAARRTTRIAAVSDYVRAHVARELPVVKDRLVTVRNGVDSARFADEPWVDSGADSVTFATVSRLTAWKRIDWILRAVSLAPRARLIVAGAGEERARLEALAHEVGVHRRVNFTGHVDDPGSVLASADVAVNASKDEPFGLAILEALAKGRPVVAFRGGGVPEFVRHGETGWLVENDSVEALAAAMRSACSSRASFAGMGRNARRFAETEGEIRRTGAEYAATYRDVVRSKSLPPPPSGSLPPDSSMPPSSGFPR
ncbi:MAG: glycosyltransferase family 4 protein [Polyangiaceae bacterium]